MEKQTNYITLATTDNSGIFDQSKEFVKYGTGKIKTLFYNEELNNLIVVNTHQSSNAADAIGFVVGKRFDYLSQVLRNEKNVIAVITKVEGETSDYVISYDFENPKELLALDSAKQVIEAFRKKSLPVYSYKCIEIKNGEACPISFEEKVE